MDKKDKFQFGLSKTKKSFAKKLADVFTGKEIDEDVYEELIELLITSDVPFSVSEQIIENAKKNAKKNDIKDKDKLMNVVAIEAKNIVDKNKWDKQINFPCAILFVGVNGVGKTTTIAKLANKFKKEGKSVSLVAADTFRAAACEQLDVWAKRINVPIIKSREGQDPSSVVFDGLSHAKAKNVDVLLCDTAGRLQSKQNLMDELNKIYRVLRNNSEDINIYTLMVLDAGAGQNSIVQAESFSQSVNIDGIIMTKLDGSAKGGVLLGLSGKVDVPIWYVGLGEGLEDMVEFDSDDYIKGIFE